MTNPKTLRIGVTGGIGSGKSTVCKVFSLLGIPIYAADEQAKRLMTKEEGLKKKILSAFGSKAYTVEGELNRPFLANTVFSDPEKLESLNALVHPAVAADFDAWANTQTSPYVIKEAALLFETDAVKQLDYVINVSSPLKIRLNRILLRDPHRSEMQVNQIIDQQLPDEQKNERADFIVKNQENKLIIPQVLDLHNKLCALSQKG